MTENPSSIQSYMKVDDSFEPLPIFACGTCGRVYAANNIRVIPFNEPFPPDAEYMRNAADRCCTCRQCRVPVSKGPHFLCEMCNEHENKRRRERVYGVKVQVVADHTGWVYSDEVSGYKDGFFESADDLLDYCLANPPPTAVPRRAFCCTRVPVKPCDVSQIIEWLSDNHAEEVVDAIEGIDDLQAALDAFEAANKDLYSWDVDYSRYVEIEVPSE